MNVNLSTLTPVHIGSGIDFQGNVEYLWFSNTLQAAILDDEKVLDIIGAENIAHWVSCIEKGEPLLPLLEKRSPGLSANLVAKRVLQYGAGVIEPHKTLREQLHSANGQALMPGSSLKGALRTVVWAEQIFKQPEIVKLISNLGDSSFDRRSGKERFTFKDEHLSQQFFGKDPNHDIFRLWQIGDAHFSTPTALYRTEVVNLYRNDEYRIKAEIAQQIEAIPAGIEAHAHWKFNELLEKSAESSKLFSDKLFNRNTELLHPAKLFASVNQHTMRLVGNELEFWKAKGNPVVLGTYLDHLERILKEIQACDSKSCVLRLGWGSGFRSMTGDWHINMTDDDYYDLVASLRPNHDETLEFPKTTRFIEGGEPLGFIKILMD